MLAVDDDTFKNRFVGSSTSPSVNATVSFPAIVAWNTTYRPAANVAVAVFTPMLYVAADDDVLQITMLEIIVDVDAVEDAAYNCAAVVIVPLPAAAPSCLYTVGILHAPISRNRSGYPPVLVEVTCCHVEPFHVRIVSVSVSRITSPDAGEPGLVDDVQIVNAR